MTNNLPQRRYDLAERTALFGESVIEFVSALQQTPVNRPLISQIVRSATSVGANYMEADVAESKPDFFHKIGICLKEAKETIHWLRMLLKANPTQSDLIKILSQEALELVKIFAVIRRSR